MSEPRRIRSQQVKCQHCGGRITTLSHKDTIVRMALAGETNFAIARVTGLDNSNISVARRKWGLPLPRIGRAKKSGAPSPSDLNDALRTAAAHAQKTKG